MPIGTREARKELSIKMADEGMMPLKIAELLEVDVTCVYQYLREHMREEAAAESDPIELMRRSYSCGEVARLQDRPVKEVRAEVELYKTEDPEGWVKMREMVETKRLRPVRRGKEKELWLEEIKGYIKEMAGANTLKEASIHAAELGGARFGCIELLFREKPWFKKFREKNFQVEKKSLARVCRPKEWTDQVEDLLSKGASIEEIAEATGRTRDRIKHYLESLRDTSPEYWKVIREGIRRNPIRCRRKRRPAAEVKVWKEQVREYAKKLPDGLKLAEVIEIVADATGSKWGYIQCMFHTDPVLREEKKRFVSRRSKC